MLWFRSRPAVEVKTETGLNGASVFSALGEPLQRHLSSSSGERLFMSLEEGLQSHIGKTAMKKNENVCRPDCSGLRMCGLFIVGKRAA